MESEQNNLASRGRKVSPDGAFNLGIPSRLHLAIALAVLVIIAVYAWFVSFGTWTVWPTRTTVYQQLANSFADGQLYLKRTPDAALLALENPYNPKARAGYSYPQDASLYDGKYYYYFGPVPALMLMAVTSVWTAADIGDQYIAFAFLVGLLIVQTLFLVWLWYRYFRGLAQWTLLPGILFVGLAAPFCWNLTQASVYIAASTGAQFFFLLGLYLGIRALEGDAIRKTALAAAGISWALALGCRLTQILPIGFGVILLALLLVRKFKLTHAPSDILTGAVLLAAPIALGLAGLAWYNWARFDSVFETGLYYQLAGPYLQKNYDVLFSSRYILPNMYDYFVMRPGVINAFPYLESLHGYGSIKFAHLDLPRLYYEGQITGLIYTTPFVLFAGIPFIASMWRSSSAETQQPNRVSAGVPYHWTVAGLLGSFLLGFATLAPFFWVLTRYLVDCVSPLLLLSVAGFWQGDQELAARSWSRSFYRVIGAALFVTSIVVGNLLAIYASAMQAQKFDAGF
jgi:hypothetical protein